MEDHKSHDALLCIQTGQDREGHEPDAVLLGDLLCQNARGDEKILCPCSRGDLEHHRDRRALQPGDGARQVPSSPFPRARRLHPGILHGGAGPERARRALQGDRGRARQGQLRPGSVPETARIRDRDAREDGLCRLLPDRLGLHPLCQGARHPGGPGPRFRRRQPGRLLPQDHRPRPPALQPAVRAVPEPRTHQHA